MMRRIYMTVVCMYVQTYIYTTLCQGTSPITLVVGFDHDSSKPHNLEKTREVPHAYEVPNILFELRLIYPGCQLEHR